MVAISYIHQNRYPISGIYPNSFTNVFFLREDWVFELAYNEGGVVAGQLGNPNWEFRGQSPWDILGCLRLEGK